MVADAYDAVSALRRCPPTPTWCWTTTSRRTRSTTASPPGPGSSGSFDGEAVGELDELRADFVRKAVLAGTDRVLPAARCCGQPTRRSWPRSRSATSRRRPSGTGCAAGGPSSGCPPATTRPLLVDPATGAPVDPGRRAAAPAPGPADPDRASTPTPASAGACCGTGTPAHGRGEEDRMKAVRLHGYHQQPVVEDVPEPDGQRARSTWSSRSAAPACAAPTCTSSRASGPRRWARRCPTRSATRTPAGCTRSAPR